MTSPITLTQGIQYEATVPGSGATFQTEKNLFLPDYLVIITQSGEVFAASKPAATRVIRGEQIDVPTREVLVPVALVERVIRQSNHINALTVQTQQEKAALQSEIKELWTNP